MLQNPVSFSCFLMLKSLFHSGFTVNIEVFHLIKCGHSVLLENFVL